MLQRCKTNGFHRRSRASSTPTSPSPSHLPGRCSLHSTSHPPPPSLPTPLLHTAACAVALEAAVEVNVQFESSAPRMCFASQALQQRVCPCVCVCVSVYAFILIYYGHGFFGTKICLLYKKRKQRQANKKSRTTVRGVARSVCASASACARTKSRPHPHTHTQAWRNTHSYIKRAQQKASLRQILRSDKKMIKR